MASLSVSLLSYAASLAQNDALDNNTLIVLNSIWFITTGGSLFIAGSTGLVAAVIGTLSPPAKPNKARLQFYANGVTFFMILGLFIMLFAMVAGLILLANSLAVNTRLGNVHLPPAVIFPLLAVAVVIMIIVSSLMYLGSI